MEVITTHGVTGGQPTEVKKPFTWSYSRIKNFEVCPRKYYTVDVLKKFSEGSSEQLTWGNEVHDKAAARVKNGTPLPTSMAHIEPWIKRITSGSHYEIFVEQKLAITKDFAPTTYFAKDVWFRAIIDVCKLSGDVALAVDWKTGKILEDGIQLALSAACVFIHYPQIQRVRSEFIWLKDDASSRVDFSREQMRDIWRDVLPRVASLEAATTSLTFPPKPGRLCKRFCPDIECPHHGIG